jgi:transcriptional antiterminator Rof (Rho-off)
VGSKQNEERIQVEPEEHTWRFPIGYLESFSKNKLGKQQCMQGTGTIIS